MLDTLTAEPLVPCHRDFMARNLIPVGASPALAVIDHQDLRLGPASYDLASLLNDSLFAPVEVEDRLVAAALPQEQRLQYHRAAAQRTLKAVGTFLAFAKRGEDRHLPLIAPSLASARRHLLELPECENAQHEVRSLWLELGTALATSGPKNPIC
jgi:aminoglycoside/choline kinase family phosphotransferase